MVRATRVVAVIDLLTVPALRRLLQGALGVGLATTAALATVRPTAPPPTARPAVHFASTQLASTVTTGITAAATEEAETVTMRRLPDTAAALASPEELTATWTVQWGQCFWSIAEQLLAQAWDRSPTDAEIVPYWQALIEANRHSLADPTNADLIFSGQVFRVPPPPEPPS